MDKLSYGLGLGIGQQLASMNIEQLNLDDFMCAIKDILNNIQNLAGNEVSQKTVHGSVKSKKDCSC